MKPERNFPCVCASSWLGGTGVSEIPSSGGNGTGVSEIPSSGGNYSLPGQITRDSDHMPFLFPINEDDDDVMTGRHYVRRATQRG